MDDIKVLIERAMDGTPLVVTKWITLVEVFDPADGGRHLMQVCSDDLMTWEAAGMLYTSLHDEVEDD